MQLHPESQVLEMEPGMRPWKIEVEDFPAFVVIDDKGNVLLQELNLG